MGFVSVYSKNKKKIEAPKSLQMMTEAVKLKNACSFKEKLWPT